MCVAMLFGPDHSLVFQHTGILRFFLFLIKKPGSRQHPVPGLPDIQRIPCAKNAPSGIPLKRKSLVLYLGAFSDFCCKLKVFFRGGPTDRIIMFTNISDGETEPDLGLFWCMGEDVSSRPYGYGLERIRYLVSASSRYVK